jgi:hypothetical protein
MTLKTRHYTVIYDDGCIQNRAWGGNASSLRMHLENQGFYPTAIFHKVRSLWEDSNKRLGFMRPEDEDTSK